MIHRKSLSDILRHGDRETLARAWDVAKAAEDFGALPAAEYVCHAIGADLFNAKQKGTPGVKLTFKVLDAEYAGRHVWHDCWLTEAAMPQTKRDLGKLGIADLAQLEQPLPPGIRARVKVTLRRDDDGTEHNRVKTFTVVGIDRPDVDPFAPAPSGVGSEVTPPTSTTAADDSAGMSADLGAGGAT